MLKMSRRTRLSADTILILGGIFSAAFGLKGFLLSSHFIDGGVTGISMLLSKIFEAPLSMLLLLMNLPFILIAFQQMGWRFAVKSAMAITGLSLCLALVHFPDVTPDKLLTAIFGGFFIGAGIGLTIRGGAVLDGTEIAALLISRATHILRVGDVILLLNIVIFLFAAFFLGVEPALYSVLTYLAASRTIDFILHGIEEFTGITIISLKNEEIRQAIVRELNRSATVYKGRRGSSDVEQDILFCVVTRLEIALIKNAAREIDENAFIMMHTISDVEGGVVKKSRFH
ncbi:MAG: hypothetical protein K0Q50_1650 [Vampirovibrio sp.]|jgi:uncharacterized membrane-anchored protein YitT (DUF2179 family)|nr:hypothetical protein [Vampirovibrio sp.]